MVQVDRRADPAAALGRYVAEMRRQRVRYVAIIAAAVVGLAAFAAMAWSRGEAAHVTLHTVRRPPPPLAIASPSTAQQLAWRTSDRLAIGTPQHGGTVVTYSTHTVRGRDARTGAQTWSYTRTDRSACSAVQIAGTTIAVYAVHGNCDELTALDSGTGKRVWTRTLDKDGMPLNGRPAYGWTSDTFLVTSRSVMYAIDPAGGLDRWTYYRYGCDIRRAVLGTSGVLISQNCVQPRCAGLKFCTSGPQLVLRSAGDPTQDDKPNRDQIKWLLRGNSDVPVSAGPVIAAINGTTRSLDRFRVDNGRSLGSAALDPAPASLSGLTAVDAVAAEVLWIDGRIYAFAAGRDKPVWSARAIAPPTVVSTTAAGTVPDLPTARITVPTTHGVAILDGQSGLVLQSFDLPVPARDSAVYPLGTGFLVASPAGTIAYR